MRTQHFLVQFNSVETGKFHSTMWFEKEITCESDKVQVGPIEFREGDPLLAKVLKVYDERPW